MTVCTSLCTASDPQLSRLQASDRRFLPSDRRSAVVPPADCDALTVCGDRRPTDPGSPRGFRSKRARHRSIVGTGVGACLALHYGMDDLLARIWGDLGGRIG